MSDAGGVAPKDGNTVFRAIYSKDTTGKILWNRKVGDIS